MMFQGNKVARAGFLRQSSTDSKFNFNLIRHSKAAYKFAIDVLWPYSIIVNLLLFSSFILPDFNPSLELLLFQILF